MIPDIEQLRASLRERTTPEAWRWLEGSADTVTAEPDRIRALFPAVGRKVGRGSLAPEDNPGDPHAWTVDDAGRALLLADLGDLVSEELGDLYRYGDAAERRGVLRALPYLPVGGGGVPLVEDALRTNDTRLIVAALGPYAFARFDDASLSQGILKCVFMGVPISPLEGLEERANPELSRMLADHVHERVAAGRETPAEVWTFIDRFTPLPELAAIRAELESPVEERRRAAAETLAERQEQRRIGANL